MQAAGDRVLVEVITEKKTASGLFIPDMVEKDKTIKSLVIAVGPNVAGFKAGDEVLHSKFSGADITIDKKEYLILREGDIYITL
jgi:chaperonin GroES